MPEPENLIVGDTWSWTRSVPDYLSTDSYVLTYSLTNADNMITITASGVADGSYSVSVPAATTAGYTSGEYIWNAHVTLTTNRFTVGTGVFHVNPNPANGAVDLRSDVKKTLDALDALILGKASKDQLSYSINGRSISRLSPEELIAWQQHYQRLYNAEQAAVRVDAGKKAGNRVLFTF